MTPIERLEHQFVVESFQMQLKEAKAKIAKLTALVAKLEIQMRREGWTQADLDAINAPE